VSLGKGRRVEVGKKMKKVVAYLVGLLLFAGCTQPPSELTCDALEQRRAEFEKYVDFWAQYKIENLSNQEKIDSSKAVNDYFLILREMDSAG
jgi:DMSO/TMAO reductase YedYZ molybdopterin-dependent catalytic subunit